MTAIIAIIGVISATYHELIGRFPGGGGGPEGIARAFGEGWAFVPLGALLVDFTLTVAVLNIVGAALVAIILGINATRLDGLIALLTSGGVAVYLFRIWVSRGRPKGVAVAGVQ